MATNEASDIRPDLEVNQNSPEHAQDTTSSTSPCNSGGSIFSSPKLVTGPSSNPFAVRVSPGRHSNSDSNNGDGPNHPPVSSIIAPSKFGAPAAITSASSPSSLTSPPLKPTNEAAECNGSSKQLLRPSLIGPSSGSSSSSNSSILKPSTLGTGVAGNSGNSNSGNSNSDNPFSRAVDVLGEDESDARRKSTDRDSTAKPSLLFPSRLSSVTAFGVGTSHSPTAPAAAGEDGEASGSSNSTANSSDSMAVTAAATIPARSIPMTGNLFSAAIGSTPTQATACTNFVFGQKLHERVANANHTVTEPTSNGTSTTENLFTVAPKEKTEAELATSNGVATKSLSDSARKLEEEARAAKRKYEEVTVVTGEEDEQNALQVYGKLFTFDKTQSTWVERGRGTLRLNDKQIENDTLQSRLVMRTQGCLRVILNTKIWAEMTVDKTSSKSIRLTAVDGDQIRVFLLMTSPKDTETLFNALEWRLATLRAQQSRAAAAAAASPNTPTTSVHPSVDAAPSPKAEGELPAAPTSPKRRSTSGPDDEADQPEEAKKKRSD